MQYRGVIPSGTTCDQLASTIDVLPTVARFIGAELPELPLDGRDIYPLLIDDSARSPHASFPYYYADGQLIAIRNDRWKLVFPHEYRTLTGVSVRNDGLPAEYIQTKIQSMELYDLDTDIGETLNVAEKHPDIVSQLLKHAEKWRGELGDSLNGTKGTAIRPLEKLRVGDQELTSK
jgi:arylsulfatase A-like enzyme